MLDPFSYFQSAVAETLRRCKLTSRNEIVSELATHLSDHYESLLSRGIGPQEALELTLTEVGDPRKLCRQIQCAKGEDMMSVVRRIFLPGMVCAAAWSFSNWALMRIGFRPNIVWVRPDVPFFIPMLPEAVALTLSGALAAMLVRSLKGSRRDQLLAAATPMLLITAFLLIGSIAYLAWWTMHRQSSPQLTVVLLITACNIVSQGVIPSLFACLGGMLVGRANPADRTSSFA